MWLISRSCCIIPFSMWISSNSFVISIIIKYFSITSSCMFCSIYCIFSSSYIFTYKIRYVNTIGGITLIYLTIPIYCKSIRTISIRSTITYNKCIFIFSIFYIIFTLCVLIAWWCFSVPSFSMSTYPWGCCVRSFSMWILSWCSGSWSFSMWIWTWRSCKISFSMWLWSWCDRTSTFSMWLWSWCCCNTTFCVRTRCWCCCFVSFGMRVVP